jgi:hypothetical protein
MKAPVIVIFAIDICIVVVIALRDWAKAVRLVARDDAARRIALE